MTGRRFGRLVVLRLAPRRDGVARRYWLCVCDCGNTSETSTNLLTSGHTSSCGCLHREQLAARNRTHGLRDRPEYTVWSLMRRRCLNEGEPGFPNYGGRGIKICQRWLRFENFYADMGPRPTRSHSLDRIDNDGNYEPTNCRWATREQQARNTRRNRFVTAMGRTLTCSEWDRERGFSAGRVQCRLSMGWSEEDAVTRPLAYQKGKGRTGKEQMRRRREAEKRATPKWLTTAQREEIRKLQRQAAERGKHCDHIEPILGRLAMGLHVPWNMQIIEPKENWSKNNRTSGSKVTDNRTNLG